MAKIKTRETVKDIKVFDRAADVSTHMKDAFIKSKDTAEQTQDSGYNNPENYATDHVTDNARGTAEQAANKLKNPHKKASENVNKAKRNFQDAKRHMNDAKNAVKKPAADQPKKEMVKRAQKTARQTTSRAKQTADKTIKTVQKSEKTIKQSAKTIKATGKGTVKTVGKSVKTAERTAKTAIKTTQQAAKTAQKTAQAAAKAAKAAAHAAKVAAKVAVTTVKAAVKVTIATVKAIIAATKALIAAIAAGGWVAVVVILIICMIGLLIGSVFGIFFSGEDSGNGYTMPMAIAEINTEYTEKINEIRNSNTYDEVVMSGTRANWKEVLAVYAVKTNTDPENAQDVATMDEGKKALLQTIFWDMNVLSHRTESKSVTVTTVTDDGEGNLVETEETVTKTFLYITVSGKSTDDMAAQYGFSTQQKAQLAELLSDEYVDLWSAVLYGIHNGSGDIVAVAAAQIGNVGGEPYWSWYGFGGRVEWCACFVSWCANECGYIDAGIVPMFAACTSQGMPWFQERGLWQEAGYIPAPGDIIFFNWDGDQSGGADHVGIVEYVEGEVVHTIEGNTSDSCARRSYRLDSNVIRGYGTPMY